MTWDDLLEELRGVVEDTVQPFAWSDTTLLGFLSEGQDKFCEDTGFFRDSSQTITLEEGVTSYVVPARTIEILGIWYGYKKLTFFPAGTDFTYANDDWSTPITGIPTAWRADDTTGSVTIYPIPSADMDGVDLSVKVWRYGADPLATSSTSPELPGRLQRACIEWAAYKVLNFHYAETQDPIKAKDHLEMYKSYVRDGISMFRRSHGIDASVGTDPAYRT